MADALAKRLEALEAEAAAGVPTKDPPQFADHSFPEQAAFIEDPAQLIMLLCTRRAGKSLGAGRRLYKAATARAGVSCLYIALTRESAKKIMWKDALKPLNKQLGLGARFNETDLTATLPNGSVVYLLGVDSTEEEKEKLLGQRYAEVVIDEAASFSIDVKALVYGVLKPAVADFKGAICLVGTPGNLKKGLYFDLTNGHDPMTPGRWSKLGWSGHRWDTARNPYMRERWAEEIADLVAANPLIQETPLFQQNYLGRWVIDESKLVYRFAFGRNEFDGKLPFIGRGRWHYVLGVDLGFDDATSFSLGAYHDHDRTLLILKSWKRAGMDITDVATEIKAFEASYQLDRTVIDGANKQAVQEMRNRHNLPLEAADKKGKAEFIDIMNSEFIQGRIRLGPECQPLKDEYAGLIWDERSLDRGKREEHPNCENHCADGTLYLWRFCYQYMSEPLADVPRPGTEAYAQKQEADMRAEAEKQWATESPMGGVGDSSNWEPLGW